MATPTHDARGAPARRRALPGRWPRPLGRRRGGGRRRPGARRGVARGVPARSARDRRSHRRRPRGRDRALASIRGRARTSARSCCSRSTPRPTRASAPPPLRAASRRLGRQLAAGRGAVLAGDGAAPTPLASMPDGPHQAVRARAGRAARPGLDGRRRSRALARAPRDRDAGAGRRAAARPRPVRGGRAGRPGSRPTVRPSCGRR